MAFKNKNIVRDGPFFTHLASLPFITPQYRSTIRQLQSQIRSHLHTHPKYLSLQHLKQHHHNQCHITLFKLVLRHNHQKERMVKIIQQYQEVILEAIKGLTVVVESIKYFTRFNKNQKCRELTVVYGQIDAKSVDILNRLTDKLMRILLKEEVIVSSQLKDMNVHYDHTSNLYKPQTVHISLFRARNLLEDDKLLQIFKQINKQFKPFEFTCHHFDISTMGKEFDHTEFYLPLHRLHLTPPQQKQQIKQESINKIQQEV